jgi:hypothetical protein
MFFLKQLFEHFKGVFGKNPRAKFWQKQNTLFLNKVRTLEERKKRTKNKEF